METYDVIIIGAGLLGCFAARALASLDIRTLVLERREDVSTGISKAGSGIVYSGYDNKPGTLKARLCVQACRDFPALCETLDVPFRKCGSLMFAFGDRGERVLEKKFRQGQENGVEGIKLLGPAETLDWEPLLPPSVRGALYVPGTGTVEPWALCVAAYENARANGIEFHFLEKLLRIERRAFGFYLETEQKVYQARVVLNCAGLEADAVREMLCEPAVRLFPTGGEYLVLDKAAGTLVHHVLFHEPEEKGMGLTAVPTVDGKLLLGHTERPAEEDFSVEEKGIDHLRRLCEEVLPGLPMEILRAYGTVRPNPRYVHRTETGWAPSEKGISDFTFLEEEGFFSFLGIKTPGMTCAEALGKYALGKIRHWLGDPPEKRGYNPARQGIPRPGNMGDLDRAAFIQEHPSFGKIVCLCGSVSSGEIQEAIRRGACTVNGVKRRCSTGMGPCQGSRCTQEVLTLLAEKLGCEPEKITLDGPGSQLLAEDGHGAV